MSFPALAGAVAAAAGTAFAGPDECPDVARHARPRRRGDYRPMRTQKCPSCGFWCLPAPASKSEAAS